MKTNLALNIRKLREEYEKMVGVEQRDSKYNKIPSTKDGWVANEKAENRVVEGRKEILTATAQNITKVLNNNEVNKQKKTRYQ